jgi:hypothetical protein
VVVIALRGNGPVNQEQVDVGHLQLLERAVDGPFDLFGLVQVVPDLCADEEVAAGDGGRGGEEVAHCAANFFFVLVEPGAVEVAVAGLQGLCDRGVGLAFGALVGEGAEADGGDVDAIVEFVGLLVGEVGHGCGWGGGVICEGVCIDGYGDVCEDDVFRRWEDDDNKLC